MAREPKQFLTPEALKNLTTSAAAITLTCGVVMSFYKNGTGREIALWIVNSVALAISIGVVIANNIKRDPLLNRGQYCLLILFNSVILYASVVGATGITSNFRTAQKKDAGVFAFILPTRPLYGVSNSVHNETKNALIDAKQVISAVEDYSKNQKDTLLSTVIFANSNNVNPSPSDPIKKTYSQADKIDPIYEHVLTYWVYLGQIVDEKWTPKNFGFEAIPNSGQTIIAKKSVYKRDAAPLNLHDDYWQLGKVMGVINPRESVHIGQVLQIEGDNFWAEVSTSN